VIFLSKGLQPARPGQGDGRIRPASALLRTPAQRKTKRSPIILQPLVCWKDKPREGGGCATRALISSQIRLTEEQNLSPLDPKYAEAHLPMGKNTSTPTRPNLPMQFRIRDGTKINRDLADPLRYRSGKLSRTGKKDLVRTNLRSLPQSSGKPHIARFRQATSEIASSVYSAKDWRLQAVIDSFQYLKA